MLQVGFGTDFGHGPLGKLAAEEEAEALAEDQAAGALAELGAGTAAEIEEEELSFAAGEAFHGEGERALVASVMAVRRRLQLRVRSHTCKVRREPRISSE